MAEHTNMLDLMREVQAERERQYKWLHGLPYKQWADISRTYGTTSMIEVAGILAKRVVLGKK